MSDPVNAISFASLFWVFGLMALVVLIYFRWSLKAVSLLHATFRMLLQLVLVGYTLSLLFQQEKPLVVLSALGLMLLFACLIALRPLKKKNRGDYLKAFFAIALGGVPSLMLVTQGVMGLKPWFAPRYLIPLAGMTFANAMNALSLAAERFESEMGQGRGYFEARAIALQAALIPLTNSLFAVGIVSIPGLMTGQILSGTSPLIAARYQIMVMCMVFGSAGLSSAIYLRLQKKESQKKRPPASPARSRAYLGSSS